MKEKTSGANRQIKWLVQLLDSRFRIPGTDFRFGVDPLLGLIPGFGDFVSFLVSSFIISSLARNGASGNLLAKMVLNVLVDTFIGAIPFVGDIFDFGFRSNQRNLRLMEQHHTEGRHKGGAWKVIVPVILILLIGIAAIVWGSYKLIAWLSR